MFRAPELPNVVVALFLGVVAGVLADPCVHIGSFLGRARVEEVGGLVDVAMMVHLRV